MTRYLPIRKEEFDLRSHVESAGHCIDTCPFVIVSEKMCKGHLVKMGGKIKSWKKRWFVFDRLKRTFSYYVGMFYWWKEKSCLHHLTNIKQRLTAQSNVYLLLASFPYIPSFFHTGVSFSLLMSFVYTHVAHVCSLFTLLLPMLVVVMMMMMK